MSLKLPRAGLSLALLPLFLAACTEEEKPSETSKTEASSYAYIQTRIFDARCVKCHKAGEDFAEESGLLLTADVSHASLVDKPAKNKAAAADSMKLVVPGKPEKSFLYRKLVMAVEGDTGKDHSAHGGKDFGKPMPFGKKPLSNGHVEFVRQWILAGAPKDGHVADAELLQDTVPGSIPEYVPLAPPAPGEGFQIAVEKFPLPPQFEREFFVYKPLGNDRDIYVNRFKIKMRPGSHHFLLYMYDPDNPQALAARPAPGVFREIRNLDGTLNPQNMTALGDFAFVVAGTQIPEDDLVLPAGVALHLPAGLHLDFNSHYVNYTDEVAYGEVAANMYTVDSSRVKHVGKAINMGNTSFVLPPNRTTVVTTDFPVGEYMRKNGKPDADSMRIAVLFSHSHKLGKRFVVTVKGGAHAGDTLYLNDDWHHPPYRYFDPPVTLSAKDTVTSVVTYDNDASEEVGFGFKSTDEMNIIFGFWY